MRIRFASLFTDSVGRPLHIFTVLDGALKAGAFEAVNRVLADMTKYLEEDHFITEDDVILILMSAAPKPARPFLPDLPKAVQATRAWLMRKGFSETEICSLTDAFL